VFFVLISLGAAGWLEQAGGAEQIWARFGWWGPAASVPIHAMVSLSPMPSDLIALANGALYGPLFGSMLSWGGWYLAAWVRFWVGRRAGLELPIDTWWARLPEWLQRLPVGHPVFLILSRYIPYVGGEISTLVPGVRGVGAWRFGWCTAVAIAPYALLLGMLGSMLN